MAAAQNRLVGDPNEIIALASERSLLALREAEAWQAIEEFARAHALRAFGADASALALSAAAAQAGHARVATLNGNPLYAGLPPLVVTHPQVVSVLDTLISSL